MAHVPPAATHKQIAFLRKLYGEVGLEYVEPANMHAASNRINGLLATKRMRLRRRDDRSRRGSAQYAGPPRG